MDYPSEHYSKAQNKHAFVSYDIPNDSLPFTDNSVEMIYCSHVVEHIENNYVIKMMEECHRTIKEGGGLRLACPDTEFLYDITKCGKEYWEWMSFLTL
ncbi:MAG: methyltransferase domain-containing protein [Lachnospiraceae bacterium]